MTEHIFCSIFGRLLKQCTLPSTLVFPTLYSSTFSQHLLPWLVSCKPARPPHPWTRPAAGQPEHNFLPFHNFLVPTWYRLQPASLHFQPFTQVHVNNPLPTRRIACLHSSPSNPALRDFACTRILSVVVRSLERLVRKCCNIPYKRLFFKWV